MWAHSPLDMHQGLSQRYLWLWPSLHGQSPPEPWQFSIPGFLGAANCSSFFLEAGAGGSTGQISSKLTVLLRACFVYVLPIWGWTR